MLVAVGGGLPGPGFTFIADESVGADLWQALTAQVGKRASKHSGDVIDGAVGLNLAVVGWVDGDVK